MFERDPIRIHHISDLHIPTKLSEDMSIHHQYISFLEKRGKKERPDFLVITGDLPLGGGQDIKNEVNNFLKELWDPEKMLLNADENGSLEDKKKSLKARTLLVPGNHDVCWDIKKGDQKVQSSEDALANLLSAIRKKPWPPPNPYTTYDYSPYAVSSKGHGVAAFAHRDSSILFCCFDSTIKSGQLDNELSGLSELVEGAKSLFNDALNRYTEDMKNGKAKNAKTLLAKVNERMRQLCRIDPGCVALTALAEIDGVVSTVERGLAEAQGGTKITLLRIAIVHHNPCVWSPDDEKKRFALFPNACEFLSVLRLHGFHLVLCGHAHQPCLLFHHDHFISIGQPRDRVSRRGLYIVGAGSLSSPSEREHSFNELLISHSGIACAKIELNIFEFESKSRQFVHSEVKSDEIELDLIASSDKDSLECAKIAYGRMSSRRNQLGKNHTKAVQEDFDHLKELFENVLRAKKHLNKSLRSAGDWHLPHGKRYFLGLKKIAVELAKSLCHACDKRLENSSVRLYAVHARGSEFWMCEEVWEYLDLQIEGQREGHTSISRIFLYDPNWVRTSVEQQAMRHLVGALDEQAQAEMDVWGMEIRDYTELMRKFITETSTKSFCTQLVTSGMIANDWVMLIWTDRKKVHCWRLFVLDPCLEYPDREILGDETRRFLSDLQCDVGAYVLDSRAISEDTCVFSEIAIRKAFHATWDKLAKEDICLPHSFENTSPLLERFGEALSTDAEGKKHFRSELAGRNKWLQGVKEIQKASVIEAVDICYSAIDFTNSRAVLGKDGWREFENIIGTDVWKKYLLRVWARAHKLSVSKGGECKRIFVLSDEFIQDEERLWERYKVLTDQFGKTKRTAKRVTLGVLLDTDILIAQSHCGDAKFDFESSLGIGNYLIATTNRNSGQIGQKYLWRFPNQHWGLEHLAKTEVYRAPNGGKDHAKKISEFQEKFSMAWSLLGWCDQSKNGQTKEKSKEAKKDEGDKDAELAGKRIAQTPEDLLRCLAYLRTIALRRKEKERTESPLIESYWAHIDTWRRKETKK